MQSIQAAIESLHAKGLCPRLHVDVTHEDAVCPDFVRDKWQEQLIIDLDPSYPLDLAFTKVGVEADLSFGGYVTRCTFPWAAIYVVADRGTGRGQVFAGHVPASLRPKYGVPEPIDSKLTEVHDDHAAKPGSRRRKRRGGAPSPSEGGIRMVEDASADEATEAEASSEPEVEAEVVEKTAQTRRSAFKVIDGGG